MVLCRLGEWFPTFRRIVDPEDEGSGIFRNVGNQSACDTAPHSRIISSGREGGAACNVSGNMS